MFIIIIIQLCYISLFRVHKDTKVKKRNNKNKNNKNIKRDRSCALKAVLKKVSFGE